MLRTWRSLRRRRCPRDRSRRCSGTRDHRVARTDRVRRVRIYRPIRTFLDHYLMLLSLHQGRCRRGMSEQHIDRWPHWRRSISLRHTLGTTNHRCTFLPGRPLPSSQRRKTYRRCSLLAPPGTADTRQHPWMVLFPSCRIGIRGLSFLGRYCTCLWSMRSILSVSSHNNLAVHCQNQPPSRPGRFCIRSNPLRLCTCQAGMSNRHQIHLLAQAQPMRMCQVGRWCSYTCTIWARAPCWFRSHRPRLY